ncbi:protein mono-ADP-ribosyltransferase PARP12-like isoform X2 [Palaemon carinicauda]|uniref:protein mono-ADP-ribosyltransferase PARP12-like isoform X2 n=1 Tax=Palaemon carinicauda TaxID=392227 RepID=UPI0035B65C41
MSDYGRKSRRYHHNHGQGGMGHQTDPNKYGIPHRGINPTMDDTCLDEVFPQRESNSRGSMSMTNMSMGNGRRNPQESYNLTNTRNLKVRQNNNHYFQPKRFGSPHHPGQHDMFSQHNNHEQYKRPGPHNSSFNPPNNQYIHHNPRANNQEYHFRDSRNVSSFPEYQFQERPNFMVYDSRSHNSQYSMSGNPNMHGEWHNSKDTIEILIDVLSNSRNLSDTIDNIRYYTRISPYIVLKAAESRKDIFTINEINNNKILRLDPKVALCLRHYSENGCSSLNCKDLHICRMHIHGECKSKETCLYGHELRTNHNIETLSNLHLDSLTNEHLMKVLKKSCKYVDKLEICQHYNTDRGCKYDKRCWKLHICRKFVVNTNECLRCTLNHDINDGQCSMVLMYHGVSTNETPRDILAQIRLLVNLSTASAINSLQNTDRKRTQTFKSTDIYGDVEVPQICIHSLTKMCKDYQKGCKYLHSKNNFHWQVMSMERWYNIPIFQSTKLENAFCDVTKCTAYVPGLGKTCTKEIIDVLGTASWEADFKNMKMRDDNKELTIRRLSTPSASVEDSSYATVFQWYFKDAQDKWVEYGDVDSLKRQEMVSNITSRDIDKQFLVDPQSTVSFFNSHYKYTIDFSKMVQVNETTSKEREVRRRPLKKPAKNSDEDKDRSPLQKSQKTNVPVQKSQKTNVPVHWDTMAQGVIHALVLLNSSTEEYREVSERLSITLPSAKIQSIQRLQNPYLWESFQSRKECLIQRECEDQLLVNKLFYGMNLEELDSICKENIDWRRRESCNKEYGLGTYFSHSAAVASKSCIKDNDGHHYLILALVIIGNIVKGEISFKRPPFDSSRNCYYDTAVDDTNAPNFFVKFEKNEYYPCYVIQLKTPQ